MATTQSNLKDVATDESTDEDEIECACAYGDPGCLKHWLENDGFDGGNE